jgi:hypothetical protein
VLVLLSSDYKWGWLITRLLNGVASLSEFEVVSSDMLFILNFYENRYHENWLLSVTVLYVTESGDICTAQ